MCGEKPFVDGDVDILEGSPPRVRGKEADGDQQGLQNGITPACAGKSSSGRVWCVQCGDHPRVCGEKILLDDPTRWEYGSPPRVRGKEKIKKVQFAARRITPACAGKSSIASRIFFLNRDHPRVCGEKHWSRWSRFLHLGSPPRVRGKVVGGVCPGGPQGITPACAGKSLTFSLAPTTLRDHPRVCGEKQDTRLIHTEYEGSPPRVRGKEYSLIRRCSLARITPACAGKRY